MAKDAELDRLKTAQDLAFQRKQTAYDTQQRAWDRRSSARDAMSRAYDIKQRAYDDQDRTWQYYQSVRAANGPRIDSLNAEQEREYENMKRAFDNASSAHDRRDGAAARSYADEGHSHKANAQECVNKRRQLVDEIRSARATHDAAKPAFQRAKADFDSCKRSFDQAKAEHERAQATFKQAKADFDQAARAFKARLDKVKADGQKRQDDKKSIAAKAGVPHQYRDDVWISKDSNGNTNVYFGGFGKPNGPGHGHYVLDSSGKVTYKRDPSDDHGSHNFTDQDDSRGSTLYDRQARSGQEPAGVATRDNATRDRSGVFYDRRREVDLHVTQYYDDNQRVSWDADGKTDRNRHWTNQNVQEGDPRRHARPSDAREE